MAGLGRTASSRYLAEIADRARRQHRHGRKAYPDRAEKPSPARRERNPRGQLRPAHCQRGKDRDRRLSAKPAVRSAAARGARQRLPARPRERDPRNSFGQKHPAFRQPAAEKPEPGRLHHRRHREFLAAVHGQLQHPGAQPYAAGAALPSRGAVFRAHHSWALRSQPFPPPSGRAICRSTTTPN